MFNIFFYGRSHCACGTRERNFCAISLSLNKEMAKENQPKGLMPFENPQRATEKQGFS